MVQAFAECGGKRIVGAGTCAEYDWRFGFCSERVTPLAPATLYGESKRTLFHLIERFAAENGLSAAWD